MGYLKKNLNIFIENKPGPHLRTPNPRFNSWFTPHICYIKGGALVSILFMIYYLSSCFVFPLK
jgi:hypothetical protein